MKGFPRIIATGADLRNCLAMVQMKELAPEGLTQTMNAIEQREFLTLPIRELSDDRKTVVVLDCVELAQGVEVENAELTTISAVQRAAATETAMEEAGSNEPIYATVTLSSALQASTTALHVKAPRDPYAEMGMTKTEFNAVKEVLKSYGTINNK